jgi:hypothetical protein
MFRGVVQKIAIEQHQALADECGGVRGLARRIAQIGAVTDTNGPALEKIVDSLQ